MYDLGQAWKDMTSLPFVFAVWASVEPVPAAFADAFSRANAVGFQHLDAIIAQIPQPQTDLKHYYTRSIQYRLDADALQGMQLFLDLLEEEPIILSPAKIT
jgi:chorismate dehydratase